MAVDLRRHRAHYDVSVIFFKKRRTIFTFVIISQRRDCEVISLDTKWTFRFYLLNTMTADVLATQGAKTSKAMELT